MIDKCFVDTNVLVYAVDVTETEKHQSASAWLKWLWEHRCGCLSYQVLSEFYVTATRKLSVPLEPSEAQRLVRALHSWTPHRTDAETLELAWAFQEAASLSFWDALIVAAAQLSHCRRLLTEDLPDGQTIGSVLVVNPFRQGPTGALADGSSRIHERP